MGGLKRYLGKAIGISESKAIQTTKALREDDTKLLFFLQSENKIIKDLHEKIKYVYEHFGDITAKELSETDNVDAFSRYKDQIGNYIQNDGDYIVKLVSQVTETAKGAEQHLHDVGYRRGDKTIRLLEKKEDRMRDLAGNIKTHTKILGDLIMFHLQPNESKDKRDDAATIERHVEEMKKAVRSLKSDVIELSKIFNDAVELADDLIGPKGEDNVVERILADHASLLRAGVYAKKEGGNVPESEEKKALHAAINNRDDELFTGHTGRHGAKLSSVLHEYNKQKYGEGKDNEQKLEDLKVKEKI